MVDVEDFQEEYAAALDAASEYERRCQKGLPYDRWAEGTAGAALVAKGIWAQERIIEMLTAALVDLMEAERARGEESMEPTPDPMR